ncbi:hypothetical protein A6V39_03240 [Candidatus Mycoplasma haematobovis]|uniref:Uncharacterized protein n=1 Tax=Candidatus Mycoplasma haematobovis TaxID=432608 RepID=A0A1A9QDX9_9MOLU|nr:hypothetical protein [Candidatus Mycoplasma haematobovis]OAL09899.1 hypothetical protein A6V39_03240 [Candidatus Mycoplasma haematobovis]
MSVEVVQKVAAVTIIAGGIGGGYFALTGGSSGTLSGMSLASGRDLIKDWDTIESNYKNEKNTNLIEGIPKEASKLQDKIKKWCETKGNTYYLGPTDKTYRSYMLWCLKEIDLDTALIRQGLEWKDEGWDKKFEKNKTALQTLLNKGTNPKQEPADANKLRSWCEENKKGRYKYLGDDAEHKVRSYCYWSKEEWELANKPQQETPPSDSAIEPSALSSDSASR